MTDPRLAQISALPDGTYELLFDSGTGRLRYVCEVQERHGIEVVSSTPSLTVMDPSSDAPDVGDPRPIAAAVLAMHRARRF
ncbi:hypothetical protein PV646_06935 [Streptomyces sp. ID05-26A]|nr:hypothetical protein [Streptomyces sp. ID05-26A]